MNAVLSISVLTPASLDKAILVLTKNGFPMKEDYRSVGTGYAACLGVYLTNLDNSLDEPLKDSAKAIHQLLDKNGVSFYMFVLTHDGYSLANDTNIKLTPKKPPHPPTQDYLKLVKPPSEKETS